MASLTATTGNWTASAGTNTSFALAATTAADEITIPNGVTVTIVAANSVVCRSLTVAAGGALIFAATNSVVSIGDATAATGNAALTINSGSTITLTGIGTINLVSTSSTQQTIASGGKTLPNLTVNGAGSSYLLSAALTLSGNLTVSAGTWNTNSQTVTAATLVSTSASTRAITLGTSTINLTNNVAATVWSISNVGTLTFTGASSTIVISTASISVRTFAGGGLTYGALQYTVAASPGQLNLTGSNTFSALNIGTGRTLAATANTTTTVGTFSGTGVVNGYVYMPGDANGAIIPDSAALSITDDMDFRQRMSFDNFGTGVSMRIAAKYLNSGGQRTWRWYIVNGTMSLDMSTTGANSNLAAATTTLTTAGLSVGTTYWMRFTREKATGNVKFYYAADNASMPSSWTQIGNTVVSTTSSLFDSAASFTIGGEDGSLGANFTGKIYRSQMRNNILDNGTGVQLDADFTAKTVGANTFTESSANAATVSMVNLSVVGDGRLRLVSLTSGTAAILSKPSGGLLATASDYLSIQDIRVNQPYIFYAGANSINVSGNSNVVIAAQPVAPYRLQGIGATATSTTVTATLATAATAGNLLILYWSSATAPGTITGPTGYTQAVTVGTAPVSRIYYKVAVGGETAVTIAQTSSVLVNIFVQEVAGWTGIPTLDVSSSNTATAATSASTTATTGPTNATPAWAAALFGYSAAAGASLTWTNNYQEEYLTTGTMISPASVPLTAAAAQSTTHTWTTSRNSSQILAVFKDAIASSNNGSFFPFF